MTVITKIKIGIALLVIALMTLIVLQNTESVQAELLFFTVSWPLSLLFGVVFAIGVAVGLLIAFSLAGKRPKSD